MAELKAELEELDLVTTGNKQNLYDRLLDYEEEWGDDGDSGLSNAVGAFSTS